MKVVASSPRSGTFLSQLPGHRVDTKEIAAIDVTAQFRETAFWALTREGATPSDPLRFFVERLAARARAKASPG